MWTFDRRWRVKTNTHHAHIRRKGDDFRRVWGFQTWTAFRDLCTTLGSLDLAARRRAKWWGGASVFCRSRSYRCAFLAFFFLVFFVGRRPQEEQQRSRSRSGRGTRRCIDAGSCRRRRLSPTVQAYKRRTRAGFSLAGRRTRMRNAMKEGRMERASGGEWTEGEDAAPESSAPAQ